MIRADLKRAAEAAEVRAPRNCPPRLKNEPSPDVRPGRPKVGTRTFAHDRGFRRGGQRVENEALRPSAMTGVG